MSNTKSPDRSPAKTRTNTTKDDDRRALAGLLDELTALYREVDASFAGQTCPASTECCRFGVTGREPYVTSIELALVQRAIAARGGARALGRTPPPLADVEDTSRGKRRLTTLDERVCPLLDENGRCAIYASRPFGCRTYWCERATSPAGVDQRAINAFVRRIKDLAARHAPEGDLGRPLTRALAGAGPSSGSGPRRRR
ncbi:YkgJ family cysteine cluster protein [Polyangium sp. 6x1]|uniref:YkgJ family cysteine cluster protein n=1 Tax=Polyangium sp. 6x1 TaxID=3042689 RepID=UPI002482A208|nr:YkgJ family cysteine cluster protein [Polyangium sp. 6x1]MDI1449704.1 YkgJ family cysteine cluster protein [Polyangium sp. 6x1]